MRRMSQYANWSKEALIAQIAALEANIPGTALTASETLGELRPKVNTKTGSAPSPEESKPKKAKKVLDFSKYARRKVAIRFAYLGWNYHGLAFQKDGHKTVEGEIIRALHKTSCIPSLDPLDCNFSRCGRTDADVSAMAQVISLELRSVVPQEGHSDPGNDSKELDYLRILNKSLPPDILVYQICLRPPPDFDARFSCLSRHYHYYFSPDGLDLDKMQEAALKLVGEHDFRNMCKIDGSKQITNFNRRVLSAEIVRSSSDSTGLCYLSLKGTAFLWNQVRSIMAILFAVGQGNETPEIIDRLLDTATNPRRPAYEIAWGVPLTLFNCEFPPMEWTSSPHTSPDLLFNEWYELLQKQAMTHTMLSVARPFIRGVDMTSRVNVGRGLGHRNSNYVKLAERPLCDSPETVNEKWLEKNQKKKRT